MATQENPNLEVVMDVPVQVTVVLGERAMSIRDVLQLNAGAVVPLDRKADQPVDLYVNNKLIARGEVVVVNEKLGLKITELAAKTP
jgi:flagellar motor switch protein FliN/FliY